MRTSPSQFCKMVSFMEENGDLSHIGSNPHGRIRVIKCWEELTEILNDDSSGDTKTVEKWKKVWSDYKNNIKKKAARLHKASIDPADEGPAVYARLTKVEKRVLKLIGSKNWLIEHRKVNRPVPPTETPDPLVPRVPPGAFASPVTPAPPAAFAPPAKPASPATPSTSAAPVKPAPHSPPPPAMPIQNCHSTDDLCRDFKTDQHQETMDIRKEEIRIREMEIENQREWQKLASRALDIIEKVADKYFTSKF